jgi:bifunctional non-homologous end joining protein LigD
MLSYVGKVGTGFTRSAREQLLRELESLARSTSPFDQSLPPSLAKGATWARPRLVGEVQFREWTPDRRLRHPVWRGVRSDKSAKDVHREP